MAAAYTAAELNSLTADPAPPALTAAQKTRVRAAIEALDTRSKKGAFGKKVQQDLVSSLNEGGSKCILLPIEGSHEPASGSWPNVFGSQGRDCRYYHMDRPTRHTALTLAAVVSFYTARSVRIDNESSKLLLLTPHNDTALEGARIYELTNKPLEHTPPVISEDSLHNHLGICSEGLLVRSWTICLPVGRVLVRSRDML